MIYKYLIITLVLITTNLSANSCRINWSHTNRLTSGGADIFKELIHNKLTDKGYRFEYTTTNEFNETIGLGFVDIRTTILFEKWDNGRACFEGKCKCWAKVWFDGKAEEKDWISTERCADAQGWFEKVIDEIPSCQPDTYYDSEQTVEILKKIFQNKNNNRKYILEALVNPRVDINIELADDFGMSGRVSHPPIFFAVNYEDSDLIQKFIEREDFDTNRVYPRTLMSFPDSNVKDIISTTIKDFKKESITEEVLTYFLEKPAEKHYWGNVYRAALYRAEFGFETPYRFFYKAGLFDRLDEKKIISELDYWSKTDRWSLYYWILKYRKMLNDNKYGIWGRLKRSPKYIYNNAIIDPDVNINKTISSRSACSIAGRSSRGTLLIESIWKEDNERVALILSRDDVNTTYRTSCGDTARSWAELLGNLKVLTMLDRYEGKN